MGVVGGEALIQPEMAPVFAGDEVTKPLMGHLMGIELAGGVQILGGGGENGVVGEGSERGVFHTPCRKVEDRHLVVFGPWKGDADLFLKEGHDGGRVGKRVGRMLRHRRLRVEAQRHIAVLLFELGEVACYQTDQVADMGLFLQPVNRLHAIGFGSLADQLPVAEHCHCGRHVADDFSA